MDSGYTGNLTEKRKELHLSVIPFTLLCGYLAIIFLCYIDWMPGGLTSLLLYGFAVVALGYVLLKGRLELAAHNVWYIAFALFCLISCLYSPVMSQSIAKTVNVLKLLLFAVMFINVVNSKKRVQIAIGVITISAFLLFLYLLSTNQLEVDERLGQSLTGNSNTFASIFMIGAICSVYFIHFAEKKLPRFLFAAVFLAQMYALAMAGGRKFFLLPLVLLCVVLIFKTDKKGRKRIFRNSIIAVALLSLALWALQNVEFLYDGIGYRMEGLFSFITGEGEVDQSTRTRQFLIEKGLEAWKQSPLLGYGITSFSAVVGTTNYAHNNYVELLCSIGILGVILYYSFYIFLIVRFYQRKDIGIERLFWLIMIVLFAFFDFGAVSYDLYIIHFMLLLANCTLRLQNRSETV